ncbi:MAG: hypothetical protein RDV48_14040 [Candidatus Eremiobacteraeota bacterium]|nr:hypothetical protein [Candidatus Eremiobacteraeota bacterium]
MSFTSSDPVSSVSQGDWTVGTGRKASQMDAQNSEYADQMSQSREAQANQKAEAEKMQADREKTMAESQNKVIQAQAQQAAG